MLAVPTTTHAAGHAARLVYRGYHRQDGLWDIEAEMSDTKTYTLERSERGLMPPGTSIHGARIADLAGS
jgi:hypothetical protein